VDLGGLGSREEGGGRGEEGGGRRREGGEGGAEVIVHEGKHDDDTDGGEDKAEDLEA
jgi:hypothetical protein